MPLVWLDFIPFRGGNQPDKRPAVLIVECGVIIRGCQPERVHTEFLNLLNEADPRFERIGKRFAGQHIFNVFHLHEYANLSFGL
ncbi:hypothetical protein D3C87_1696470 [compost metagenome]